MLKKLYFTVFASLACLISFGQAQLGRIELQKVDRQAVVVFTQYSQEIVEGTIKQKMEQLGNKGKESRSLINLNKSNFYIYKGARLPEWDQPVDLYFKTEEKTQRDVVQSTVYLVIQKNATDFATNETDPSLIEAAKKFLNNLLPQIEAYNLEVEIKKQEDAIIKIQNKINDLTDDSTSLVRRIKNLEEKLQDANKEKSKQMSELAKQRLILEAMRNKRKT